MIALLVVLSYVGYERIGRVNNELIDITAYLVPIRDAVATADLLALEQEIHLERIERFCEVDPFDADLAARELAAWEELGVQVDTELDQAMALAEKSIEHSDVLLDVVEFARLQPTIAALKEAYGQQRHVAREIIRLLKDGDKNTAHILASRLDVARDDLETRSQAVLAGINEFMARSIHMTALHEQEAIQSSWLLVVVASVLGLAFAGVVTTGLVRPVKSLLAATIEVEHGNTSVEVTTESRDEVGELSQIFNSMTQGIRETQRIKATFGQYVDPRIIDGLIEQTSAAGDRPVKQVMTVFFSDVAGFSKISEHLTAGGLVRLINQYLTLASEPITRSHGVIDKFIGDAVVAFWGPPFAGSSNHAEAACLAALAQLDQVERLNQMMPELMGIRQGLPRVDVRIGLATGELLMGNIGSEQSKAYTVAGEAVEVAEELEGASKIYGTRILITEETRRQAAASIEVREIDFIPHTGQEERLRVFELLGASGSLDEQVRVLRDRFAKGLDAYRNRDWDGAQTAFEQCLELADDQASRVFLERIVALRSDPPGPEWNGVWS